MKTSHPRYGALPRTQVAPKGLFAFAHSKAAAKKASKVRSQRERGYTMIEVMMAMGVLTVGALALIALQTATIRANMQARQHGIALFFAERWMERLRQDATYWVDSSSTGLSLTKYLKAVPSTPEESLWFQPEDQATYNLRSAVDFQGFDVAPVPPSTETRRPAYCANIRLQWVVPQQAMRADVRVWWPKANAISTQQAANTFVDCAGKAGANGVSVGTALNNNPALHYVHLSNVFRWTPRPN